MVARSVCWPGVGVEVSDSRWSLRISELGEVVNRGLWPRIERFLVNVSLVVNRVFSVSFGLCVLLLL
jgi:hypothetical protein